MLPRYIIERSEIPTNKLENLADSKTNKHFDLVSVENAELITIITNRNQRSIGALLGVPVGKLQLVSRSSKTYLRTVIFLAQEEELTEENLGKDLFEQRQQFDAPKLQISDSSESEPETVILNINEKDLEEKDETKEIENQSEVKEEESAEAESTIKTRKMADLANFRSEYLLPIWDEANPNGLDKFLGQMKSIKTLNIFDNDKSLIFATLMKGKKIEIFQALSEAQQDDLDAFATYMRGTYGLSECARRLQFESITQQPGENEAAFLTRVKDSYYRSRGLETPADAAMTDLAKSDIAHRFRVGITNVEVRRLLLLNSTTITYGNLGTTATLYSQSLRELQDTTKTTVNTVHSISEIETSKATESEPTPEILIARNMSKLEAQINDLVLKIDEPKELVCWKCGHPGHRMNECRASSKTLAKARKQSRSRERNWSRDRKQYSRSRSPSPNGRRFTRNRTPYPRSRSNSRDRSSRSPYRQQRRLWNTSPRRQGASPERYQYRNRSRSGDRYSIERPNNYRRDGSNGRRVRFN